MEKPMIAKASATINAPAPVVWNALVTPETIKKYMFGTSVSYSHFSPLSGLADAPENYHTVTIELSDQAGHTLVSLTQDNNPTEQAREHSETNWRMMLDGMKKLFEK